MIKDKNGIVFISCVGIRQETVGRGGKEREGKERGGKGRRGEGREGEGREGKERGGKGRRGEGREGEGREGKERGGKGRRGEVRRGEERRGRGREEKGGSLKGLDCSQSTLSMSYPYPLAVACPQIPAPKSNSFICTATPPAPQFGATIKYCCAEGHQVVGGGGSDYVTCTEDGVWSASAPVCQGDSVGYGDRSVPDDGCG